MNEFHRTFVLFSSVMASTLFELLGLAALGAPIISATAEIISQANRKVFLDKFAQHFATMGFKLLTLILITAILGVGLAAILSFPKSMVQQLHAPGSPLFPLYLTILAVLMLHGLYRFSWFLPKRSHLLLGLLAGFSSLTAIFMFLPTLQVVAFLLIPKTATIIGLVPKLGPLFWLYILQYVALAIAISGSMALLFLAYRRGRDNYGRDYYAFSMRLAARWAVLSMLLVLLVQPWILLSIEPALRILVLNSPMGLLWALTVLLMFVCTGFWWIVVKSSSPMRLKGLILGTALLTWLFNSMLLTLVLKLFSS